jgi:hypothetical protein
MNLSFKGVTNVSEMLSITLEFNNNSDLIFAF